MFSIFMQKLVRIFNIVDIVNELTSLRKKILDKARRF